MPEPASPAPPFTPAQATDEQLLARFAGGDTAALGELAERHERNLLGLAAGLLNGHHQLAQDAVQEAWLRVIKHAGTFAGRSSFRTWMYRIVINRCRDLREAAPVAPSSQGAPIISPAAAAEIPLRLVTNADTDEDVRTAVQALAPHLRLLVLLCYHRGLTHPQAAEVMGIPIGTLKSRLGAALAELRAEMQRAQNQSKTIQTVTV
jgi:RNA polymerase sigma-70 factor (ECF subfamily)